MNEKRITTKIESLVNEILPDISIEAIIAIVGERQHNLRESITLLEEYDKKIPGKGIHNINRPDGQGGYTGDYDIKDRPIYRPIQYVEAYFVWEDYFEWHTRAFVEMSCLHIEACLKRYCKHIGRSSLGKLLHSKKGRSLPKDLWSQLNSVVKYLYNPAKHHIPAEDCHLFTEADAIAAYFICRKLGQELIDLIQQDI